MFIVNRRFQVNAINFTLNSLLSNLAAFFAISWGFLPHSKFFTLKVSCTVKIGLFALQHQAQFRLNPALLVSSHVV